MLILCVLDLTGIWELVSACSGDWGLITIPPAGVDTERSLITFLFLGGNLTLCLVMIVFLWSWISQQMTEYRCICSLLAIEVAGKFG